VDTVLDNSDINLTGANTRATSLAGGTAYTVTTTFTTPITTAAGSYTLFIKTDGHGATVGGTNTDAGNLTESSESNNASSVSVALP